MTFAVRVVHFAAAVALFGELAFHAWIARPAGEAPHLRQRTLRIAACCLALVLLSGLAWLAVEAVRMSGLPPARALDRGTLGTVLADTLFGRAWIVRFALAAALGATLLVSRRRAELASLSAVLAAGLLGSLAWAGHAAAERGADRLVHLSADAAHLLAAGAWLGALLPLAHALARPPALELAERTVRRFSVMGIACVSVLVITGTASAWYTVGSVPALFGTNYGRLLLAKLALFAGMIALAAANRLRWTPRLRGEPGIALRRLRRNAISETSLGAAVLGVVGALGVTVPALHSQTVWPFSYTISDWRIVPAHPTTYFRSPVGYTADSVNRGSSLYRQHCASCHGPLGHGDGPVSASLAVGLPDLAEHFAHHRPGDLLWWLKHGIPGTPMPGFGARVGDAGLWNVINFLHALEDAEAARDMDAGVGEWHPIAAPEFDFQIGEHPQESLKGNRGENVLLVFCARPEADARLRDLVAAEDDLRRAGVRIVALPMQWAVKLRNEPISPVIADPEPEVVAAYSLFRPGAKAASEHFEFLIDRDGYLRARWAPGDTPDWSRMPELLAQVEALKREGPHENAPAHAH
ncbi:MAG TPA: copper homeostasis membrane protein CopD [Burkholderiales bacterium]|nr:copper homeostasis membrane protein CopD [Burkholderiales bacterium]